MSDIILVLDVDFICLLHCSHDCLKGSAFDELGKRILLVRLHKFY